MNSNGAGVQSKLQFLLQTIFSNWNFMRWLRLGLGLYLLWQLVQRPDIFTGLVAAFFLFQAITNTGCCGAGSCPVPEKKDTGSMSEEVKHEEIK
ncbi:MAG: hypothetical protein WEB30_18980 [Cyclobacteriaceae bacterium]